MPNRQTIRHIENFYAAAMYTSASNSTGYGGGIGTGTVIRFRFPNKVSRHVSSAP